MLGIALVVEAIARIWPAVSWNSNRNRDELGSKSITSSLVSAEPKTGTREATLPEGTFGILCRFVDNHTTLF
jgi:hypothetical protein